MSVRRNTIRYGAAAAVLALAIIAGSSLFAGSTLSPYANTSSVQGPSSLLVIQLTDPPHVPVGTTSLNLTYSSLDLLVGEPTGVDSQVTTSTVHVAGSATLDLLKLQNVSQTIGSVKLPDGSVIYSVTFTVSGIKIDVNGTIKSATLASGSSFTVAIAGDHQLHGTNKVLLQLNPVVVETPTGFSLIPSSVGVLRQSEGAGEDQIGWQHTLNASDKHDLDQAKGSVSANLLVLSASTITVQVNNTGSDPVTLNAIGIHGNFTVQGTGCLSGYSPSTATTTSTETETTSDHGNSPHTQSHCEVNDHSHEVVFFPVVAPSSTPTTTTATTSDLSKTCVAGQLSLVNGGSLSDHEDGGLVLNPGQCVDLSFKGIITFGESSIVLTPSILSGQAYDVHIIASNGANLQLDCVLPLGAKSCTADQHSEQD